MFFTIVIFILTLALLVLSHEFGHFISAKKFGVKVLEFGFGLPPRAWGKKFGETIYSLNWLPIGGFVKLFGEDEADKKVLDDKRSFAAQPVGQRIVIVVAGVVMNLLLAVIIFWIVLAAQGFKEKLPLLIPYQFAGVNQVNESIILVGGVAADSPAAVAGLKSGDQILTVNGLDVNKSEDLINQVKAHAGEKVTLTIKDAENKTRQVEVTPRVNPPAGQGALGVELGSVTFANLNYQTFSQKLFSGFTHSYNLTTYSFSIFGQLISTSLATKNLEPVSQSVAGPVGITNMTNLILSSQSPFIPYLNFIAMLSLNLAIVNILPFPALDGGRLFFLLIEAITRKKVNPNVERIIHTVGMVLLISLIVLITFSDIRKLILK